MAAPVLDAYSAAQSNDEDCLAWAHVCTAADLLVVCVSCAGNNTVTGITYYSVALTKVTSVITGGGESDQRVEIWRLVAPVAGAHIVDVTLAASGRVVGGASSWSGALQSSPIGRVEGSVGLSDTPTATVASAADQVVVDVMAAGPTNVTATVGAGQDEYWNDGVQKTWWTRGCGSKEAGGASVTMSWALSIPTYWAMLAATIVPPPAVAAYFSVRYEALQQVAVPQVVRYEHLGYPVSQSFSIRYESLELAPGDAYRPGAAAGRVAPGLRATAR